MLTRRSFLVGTAAVVGGVAVTGGVVAAGAVGDDRPVALIYRGPASSPGCPEAVARLVESAPEPYRAVFCGPEERVPLSAEALAGAAVYAQPGGGALTPAWRRMRGYAGPIREWVASGGSYLGFCLGGYLAGTTPGFGLLPGDTARYIATPRAGIDTTDNTLTVVQWRGQRRVMFFQDGPVFRLRPGSEATTLATYDNGTIAALSTSFGRGRVAVVGPHPEADRSWYRTYGLTDPDGVDFAMGYDLIESVRRVPPTV